MFDDGHLDFSTWPKINSPIGGMTSEIKLEVH